MDAGNIIRKLRVQNGYTQQHVADLLRVSRNAYMAWENNQVELTLRRLQSLCEVYQISMQEFFEAEELQPPPDVLLVFNRTVTIPHSFKDLLLEKLLLLKEQNSRMIRMNHKLIKMIRTVKEEAFDYDFVPDKL